MLYIRHSSFPRSHFSFASFREQPALLFVIIQTQVQNLRPQVLLPGVTAEHRRRQVRVRPLQLSGKRWPTTTRTRVRD